MANSFVQEVVHKVYCIPCDQEICTECTKFTHTNHATAKSKVEYENLCKTISERSIKYPYIFAHSPEERKQKLQELKEKLYAEAGKQFKDIKDSIDEEKNIVMQELDHDDIQRTIDTKILQSIKLTPQQIDSCKNGLQRELINITTKETTFIKLEKALIINSIGENIKHTPLDDQEKEVIFHSICDAIKKAPQFLNSYDIDSLNNKILNIINKTSSTLEKDKLKENILSLIVQPPPPIPPPNSLKKWNVIIANDVTVNKYIQYYFSTSYMKLRAIYGPLALIMKHLALNNDAYIYNPLLISELDNMYIKRIAIVDTICDSTIANIIESKKSNELHLILGNKIT